MSCPYLPPVPSFGCGEEADLQRERAAQCRT
jgi:hypothetical protein